MVARDCTQCFAGVVVVTRNHQQETHAGSRTAYPQTLGQMRECLHKEVEASMAFTLSKDYTNQSVADIEKALG